MAEPKWCLRWQQQNSGTINVLSNMPMILMNAVKLSLAQSTNTFLGNVLNANWIIGPVSITSTTNEGMSNMLHGRCN